MPRLAPSKTSKSESGCSVMNQFHFHWEMASVTGTRRVTAANVVKNAKKALRVMAMGGSNRLRPLTACKTDTITAHPGQPLMSLPSLMKKILSSASFRLPIVHGNAALSEEQ